MIKFVVILLLISLTLIALFLYYWIVDLNRTLYFSDTTCYLWVNSILILTHFGGQCCLFLSFLYCVWLGWTILRYNSWFFNLFPLELLQVALSSVNEAGGQHGVLLEQALNAHLDPFVQVLVKDHFPIVLVSLLFLIFLFDK